MRLLNRGARISLTEDGARLYEEARKVVDAYGGLQEASRPQIDPGGAGAGDLPQRARDDLPHSEAQGVPAALP